MAGIAPKADYDPAADPVHGSGWNSAARWGGWEWRPPRGAEHFRTCSFCGCIHPEDLAAERAGDGTCRTCGQQGWEACFRGKQPSWAPQALAGSKLGADERAFLQALPPDHVYDPGGWYASWADRKYGWPHKFYVEHLANRKPEVKRIITAYTEDQYQESLAGKGMLRHDSFEWHHVDAIPDGYDAGGWRLEDGRYARLGFGSDVYHHAKFYTIHLADPRLPDGVKDTIERISGLKFTFTGDGRVSWQQCSA
jgi:hypothetical protein